MAAHATDFRQTDTYRILPETYRDAWLDACVKLPAGHHLPPQDGDIFEIAVGESVSEKVRDRLNDYGLVAGCEFVVTKTRALDSIEFSCKHWGQKRTNKHKLKDDVVRKDPVTGELLSDRQRDKDDHRAGCRVQYIVSYRRKPGAGNDGEKHWIGRWRRPFDDHEGHPFPTSPMAYLSLKRRLEEYQSLESTGRALRYSKVPYSKAREFFLNQGINTVMSPKAYYNLGTKVVKDIKKDDTPGALVAVFDKLGYKYSFRKQETEDSLGRKINKIIQVVFWHPQMEDHSRRFTSNSLLMVDATFRTNKKGLPLIIGVGKSNTEKTFPVAFSWVPEEDAESYAFFFKCLREDIYRELPEPAVVLTDMSAGMQKAYNTLKCLPNSQLQFCNWHSVMAMRRWLHERGRYTAEELNQLEAQCWAYVQSNTEAELQCNRKLIEDQLCHQDKSFLRDNWLKHEKRLIKCYTKTYTNLNQYATSRVESMNSNVHKVTSHQLSLHEAADHLCRYVNDFFRDFQEEIDKARGRNIAGIDKHVFQQLTGTITKEAIKLVAAQWRILLGGSSLPCSGSFRNQNLLPCSHDLQAAYSNGYPIPKSMTHPRWWLEGHAHPDADWRPVDVAPRVQARQNDDLQALFYDVIAIHDQLPPDAARSYERKLRTLLEKHIVYGHEQIESERLALGQIDDRPRASKRPIPIVTERQKAEARAQAKAAAQKARDDAILTQRRADKAAKGTPQEVEEQSGDIFAGDEAANIFPSSARNTIAVAIRSPVKASTPAPVFATPSLPAAPDHLQASSTCDADDELLGALEEENDTNTPPSPRQLPPAATLPIKSGTEEAGRGMRKRARSGFYADLLAGKRYKY
jgi:hypothetical protein